MKTFKKTQKKKLKAWCQLFCLESSVTSVFRLIEPNPIPCPFPSSSGRPLPLLLAAYCLCDFAKPLPYPCALVWKRRLNKLILTGLWTGVPTGGGCGREAALPISPLPPSPCL